MEAAASPATLVQAAGNGVLGTRLVNIFLKCAYGRSPHQFYILASMAPQ